ncbi:MAG: cytochrome P460 family protein [Gemmatimonadaceae bacterium]
MILRALVPALFTLVVSCGDDDGSAPVVPSGAVQLTDAQVSALARAASGWTFYKNRPDTLLRSAGSGHTEARLRTRFNAIAATQLDAGGKVRAGASFPDSSLIVKELVTGTTLSRYAVMMKRRTDANASAGGWLWAYFAPDGSAQIGIGGKGAACVGCHSSGIDYVRMNDSHP